jgi:L-seryl-tRNA(Ser) seleniumtransferase
MTAVSNTDLCHLPSVDEVLKTDAAAAAISRHGRSASVAAIRDVLAAARRGRTEIPDSGGVAQAALAWLDAEAIPRLRPVFNFTGTVLHTNLGRALIAEPAIEAATAAMRQPVALEYDLAGGRRGERDDHVRGLLIELIGAEDATVVNNNAAAILLVLNSLAKGREVVVSRGELIEIGGAFRLPEIMRGAGAKLVEIGTTNRTHRRDYAEAIGDKTGLILKVHTSNYRIQGFTAEIEARDLAPLAREHNVPLVHDLGSGTIADLTQYGLAHEPTVREAVADGADLVTFSGDKLLGGPQAGFIVGRKDLLSRINRNPLKRTLRVDKVRLATLEATLRLYRDPDRLAGRLPTLRLIARPEAEIAALAQALAPEVAARVGAGFTVEAISCASEIGSGSLPLAALPSAGLAIAPKTQRAKGRALARLAGAFRRLPMPVIGRIAEGRLILDLRCLEDADAFAANLASLDPAGERDELA